MPRLRDARGATTRATPVVLLVIAAAFLLARIGTGLWEHQNPPPVAERIAWRPIAAADAESRATGRPILYDFSAAWCGPCKIMANEVFGDDKSARTIEAMFVPVHVVDLQREQGKNPPDVQALQDRFHVDAFPTLVVFNPATARSETVVGYGGKTELMQNLMQALVKVR
jgi:thiol:disulfide interchange protein